MTCSAPPTRECKWCEGRARAWFCDKHWKEFKHEHRGKDGFASDIDKDCAVLGGVVGDKYGESKLGVRCIMYEMDDKERAAIRKKNALLMNRRMLGGGDARSRFVKSRS